MSYYQVLGFEKEPFSTSPDPEFFYLSKEHEAALNNTLIELRLKRGLSVILGDVGTGKTTLSRKLIQELRGREDFIFHVILAPSLGDENQFLKHLVRNFDIPIPFDSSSNILELKDYLEEFLFEKGVKEGKTVVLVIDEAQKLDQTSLESLRLLLNFETNKFKLLQLVLLGQIELHHQIVNIPNFFDRISFKYTLNPLDKGETKELIKFRIKQGGFKSRKHLFLNDAMESIYEHTRGYPRKITMLCHKALKYLVMENKFVVDKGVIEKIIDKGAEKRWSPTESLLRKNSF